MNVKKGIGKMSSGLLLLIVVAVALVSQASALPVYFSEFQNVYGNGSCATCHISLNGGGNLTVYGTKFAGQSNHTKYPTDALRAIGAPPIDVPTKMSTFVSALQEVYGNGSCTTCHVTYSREGLAEYGKKFSAQPGHDDDPITAIKAIGPPEGAVTTAGETVNVTTAGETVNVTTTGENTEKKSPGFEIVVTIGIISAVYMLRKNKIK